MSKSRENGLSFGGNSDQAARTLFQIYGAGILAINYAERATKQNSENPAISRTVKSDNSGIQTTRNSTSPKIQRFPDFQNSENAGFQTKQSSKFQRFPGQMQSDNSGFQKTRNSTSFKIQGFPDFLESENQDFRNSWPRGFGTDLDNFLSKQDFRLVRGL